MSEVERALAVLEETRSEGARRRVLEVAEGCLDSAEGVEALERVAGRLQGAGVFAGGPWAEPRRLSAPLVKGSLLVEGLSGVVECLSELRMVALALGECVDPECPAEDAQRFLEETLALNLELAFPGASEEAREGGRARRRAERVMGRVVARVPLGNLRAVLLREIEEVCEQRQILTGRAVDMVRRAERFADRGGGEVERRLAEYVEAISGPTRLSGLHGEGEAYLRALDALGIEELEAEVRGFARSMRRTGLVCEAHAALVRYVNVSVPGLLGRALGLDPLGEAELGRHRELVGELIAASMHPSTAQAIYGLARTLERALVSRPEVESGLRKLLGVRVGPRCRRDLLARHPGGTARGVLISGVLSVLGQPLGLGQGLNPTCQSARGISLWSQVAPGYLLDLVMRAARDLQVRFRFEGEEVGSAGVARGVAAEVDLDLDPVSIVLIPHLDRVYDQMMQRVMERDQDGHRWVNPALYGPWVPTGFVSISRGPQGESPDFERFVRRFASSYHVAFNDGVGPIHPAPVGIFVTNAHGRRLGLHAVTVQRVAPDPSGEVRVYFFNPNNDGRQNWGQGILPSIRGCGEQRGESSLPFEQFVSRLYAYHYPPDEAADLESVPGDVVGRIRALAAESWGRGHPLEEELFGS